MPGTDLESLPELDAVTGETAGRKIRISFTSSHCWEMFLLVALANH
ncbi:hypothetical protein GT23_3878 [Parageobacillus thermoglucosidasius]|nr:hypothetical protein GT23_3878 [Parageobacillus thermoglucosidasius]